MGNAYNFKSSLNLKKDDIVTIKQCKFTVDNGMSSDVLYEGKKAKIISSGKMLQSRPNCPQVDISTVLVQNGQREVYLTINLSK